MVPIIAQQPGEIANQQRKQHHDAGDTDQQDNDMQPVKLGGILRRLTEQEQRHERQPNADGAGCSDCCSFYRSSVHSYQSLFSCH